MERDLREGLSRRSLMALGGGAVAAAALGFGPRMAAAQAKELVVGHWGGAGARMVRASVLPALQAKVPNARVFIREGGDLDRKAMLEANPTNPEIDVYYLSSIDAKQLAERGLVEKPDPAKVPELANLYPMAKDGYYGTYLHAAGIIYNPEKAQPTSWFDLWKPEYKGRLSIPNNKTNVNLSFICAIIRAMGGRETNPKDVAETRKKLKELKPNIAVQHTGTSQALTVMKSGDVWLGMAIGGYAYQAKDAGQSVDVLLPKEGAIAILDTVAIATHSKNKELAYAYVNTALSPPCQQAFSEIYWSPTNTKVALSDKVKARVVHGEDAVAKMINPEWDKIIDQRAEWIDWWDKNMT